MDVSEVKGFILGPWVGEQGQERLDASVSSHTSFTVTPWDRLRDSNAAGHKALCLKMLTGALGLEAHLRKELK